MFAVAADPGYAEARDVVFRLNGEIAALEAQAHRIELGLADATGGAVKTVLDLRAEKLLAGEDPSPANVVRMRDDLGAVRDRLAVARRAREIATRRLGEARMTASAAICATHAPEHRAVVGRLAEALVALGQAAIGESEFRRRLELGDVAFAGRLRAMPIPGLGDPRDRDSRIAAWFRDAFEHDLIDAKMVPATWRAAWEG